MTTTPGPLPAGFVPVPPEMMDEKPKKGLAKARRPSGGWDDWLIDGKSNFRGLLTEGYYTEFMVHESLLPTAGKCSASELASCKGCKFWSVKLASWGTCKMPDEPHTPVSVNRHSSVVEMDTRSDFSCNQFAALPKCDKCGRPL